MTNSIAIVGMACCYPDAQSPQELWENALSQRRAFRRIPPQRLRLEDYLSTDRTAPDKIYASEAALIEGYEFDRVRFRVASNTFRAADMTHWLALDIAAQALADAGFADGHGLAHQTTGVFLGNTLTGEFSRANTLRLRWPYVRRVVEASLEENEDWSIKRLDAFLNQLEDDFKSPFPPIGEESLAGGLSNTIAGRICNYFNLQGGGYTLDGACASSLLAVSNACSSLSSGDLDYALAGGVDLSLDPFELVGFAKTGALASEMMRVYDVRSNGFWPGEGCGFILLMRHEDALLQHRRVYAVIRGWGISSDGSGGITRPEVAGQMLALQRAYRRANFGIETVAYFEGHGTGTSVGDTVELKALSQARREAHPKPFPAVISSIKANIGHTKAAAGIAGLIKAAMAVHRGILPPTTGCEAPHAELCGESPVLRILKKGERWPEDQYLRAGVSSMGFGGINAHVVVEANAADLRRAPSINERALLSCEQDFELFLLGAQSTNEMLARVEHLLTFAHKLSRAELSDLAAHLANAPVTHQVRASIVASSPADLATRLESLKATLESKATERIDIQANVFLSARRKQPRIGFLFPGQGSPSNLDGGILRRRFDFVEELYASAQLAETENPALTSVAQPAIVTASLAALRLLRRLNLTAEVAVGHSLGELTALHWAGACDEQTLLRIARVRGKAMLETDGPAGAMASIGAGREETEELLNGDQVVIAGLNSSRQTVVSGEARAVAEIMARARAKNLTAAQLPVSHAFHSPLVAPIIPTLADHLSAEKFRLLKSSVVSTITGKLLKHRINLRELLCRQITSPVLFLEAATSASSDGIDLWIEVGSGQVLSGLMGQIADTPIIAIDAGGPSLKGCLQAAGAAFVLGQQVSAGELFEGHFTRPFNLDWNPKFFINPCELAPVSQTRAQRGVPLADRQAPKDEPATAMPSEASGAAALEIIIRLLAERAELPLAAITSESRLLSDLHLNSIAVEQLVIEAARLMNLPPPVSATDYANATVAEIARALEEQKQAGTAASTDEEAGLPPGIDSWIRPYHVELVERSLARRKLPEAKGTWQVFAAHDNSLADSLRQAFAKCGAGRGVVVCLQFEPDDKHVSLLLEAARVALGETEPTRFILVQHAEVAAAFARTLYLEAPHITTCVVNVPENLPRAVEWIVAEALMAEGFTEAFYDTEGLRREPIMRLLSLASTPEDRLPLCADDLLLVTGGGKGITAECALALAKESGARLVLLGRARAETDSELAENLRRMSEAEVAFRYFSIDVTDADAVRRLVMKVEAELGPVTGIIHGAARNVPQALVNLTEEMFLQTLDVKVTGARNLLAAINPEKLRLLITFGSIIARTGLPGEADYGVANERLTGLTKAWQAAYPNCRCLAMEWSIWAGVGMGERLGRIDVLVRQGITPVTVEQGVTLLRQLLSQSLPVVPLVIMGRFRQVPTFQVEQAELPLLRFLEQPRIYYPGVELVVDVELSNGTDPYLEDHQVQGERLLPAVIGLEAMAQVATALVSAKKELPTFEEVNFNRPVIMPKTGSLKIRIAALTREQGLVEVALRSEGTDFQIDHFRVTCRFDGSGPIAQRATELDEEKMIGGEPLPLSPERDLYGHILFHRGRFRRVSNYRLLKARECYAEIAPDGATAWFSHYLPGTLLLGDPGARDAAIHVIQACIPHATLLPTGVDRIATGATNFSAPLFVYARERSCSNNTFVYDLQIEDAGGELIERWDGLRLRAINNAQHQGPWATPLLGPYIERRIEELLPGSSLSVVLTESSEGVKRRLQSDRALRSILGRDVKLSRRPDGKPETNGKQAVSAAHANNLTLAVACSKPVGCDIEQVATRSASVWRNLLGQHRTQLAKVISQNAKENYSVSATRVWTAFECLKKAEAGFDSPLVFVASEADGWVLLDSGRLRLATYTTQIHGQAGEFAIAALVGEP
jgi:enediyne polyketide synthase